MVSKTSKLLKISPKTAKATESFYDGYPTEFFSDFENSKNGGITSYQPMKTKFTRIQVVLLFFMN
jgi:hypothetical protein